jgi:thiol-disulfide isomerase/thioredoxin
MKNFAACAAAAAIICGGGVIATETSDEGHMPEMDGSAGWLNSPPLATKSLRGKVVLVNFWTYSCINSLRELPYVQSWAAKYKDAGLVVIGVHSPEFAFEKDAANVKDAVAALNIAFPVPIDSSHSIWSAFHNNYWPADYFIDRNGRIRYHHYGEGEYDKSERVLQELLGEKGGPGTSSAPVRPMAAGAEAPPSQDVQSPETYAGYGRTEHFASPEQLAHDTRRAYTIPTKLALNQWGLAGQWNVDVERSALHTAPGKVVFRFHARDLHMVVGPAKSGRPIRFKVTVDGVAPGENHGVDSAPDGTGEVLQPRLYQLIRQKGGVQDRTFEIEFLDPGVEVFSFTFG